MTKLPISLQEGLQFTIQLFGYDCYNALSFLSGVDRSIHDQRARWQVAVDTVYRLLVCGLVEQPFAKTDGTYVESVHGPYMAFLASDDPFSPDFDGGYMWFDDLCSTPLCDELIAKHKLLGRLSEDVSADFIAELEALFEAHGVGWSEQPLIPVKAG